MVLGGRGQGRRQPLQAEGDFGCHDLKLCRNLIATRFNILLEVPHPNPDIFSLNLDELEIDLGEKWGDKSSAVPSWRRYCEGGSGRGPRWRIGQPNVVAVAFIVGIFVVKCVQAKMK